MKLRIPIALIALATLYSNLYAHEHTAAERMSVAANTWLDSLLKYQKAKAQYEWNDGQRRDWHYIPKLREGLSLGEMDDGQKQLANVLLVEGLSARGFSKVANIMSLESALRVIEGPDRKHPRDPSFYHWWVFGEPGSDVWGWRFEGHHVSLNFTIVDGEIIASAPLFLGSNPAEVMEGPRKGFRALALEEDLGFQIMGTLSDAQKKKAIFDAKAPREIFTGHERSVSPLDIEGLPYGELKAEQQSLLKKLVDAYLLKNNAEVYERLIAKIEKSGWENTRFAWAGPVDRNKGNYYMVQGPDFLIEFDNTQGNNNHAHAVWREFDGDFGDDLLKLHHDAHGHGESHHH